jgi:hypothetical protein
MMAKDVGDTFSFTKNGTLYTVIRRKGNTLYASSDTGIQCKLNAEAFVDETKQKKAPTP